ncbi:hypothetical protein D3C76_472110 [compost metagenome]
MNYRPLIVDHVEGAGLITLNLADALNAINKKKGCEHLWRNAQLSFERQCREFNAAESRRYRGRERTVLGRPHPR